MMARGDALQALGRSEQALEAYRRAVPMAPSSALPHALVAQTLQRLKRNGEAEKAYREALRLEPDNIRVANNLAVLLATQKSTLDEALSLARRAVDKEPGRGTYFDTLGLVLQARGDAAGARQAFERALSLEPGNAEFRQHLSQAGTATVAAMAAAVAPAKARTGCRAGGAASHRHQARGGGRGCGPSGRLASGGLASGLGVEGCKSLPGVLRQQLRAGR
jgi:Tfp pilus assembly protein PilF